MGHYIEEKGLATTSISLVRENTERIRPPRALWVPFELGRPFGAPNEPEFQTKVLSSLMSLLERTDGPVILEDFDEDPPGGHSFEESGVFCPVGFPKPVVESNTEVLREVFTEIDLMKPWYNLSLDERGRTTFGLAGLNIKEAVKFLAGFLEGTPKNPREDMTLGEVFRFTCEDVKMWYLEAATAKSDVQNSRSAADWFWGETNAGKLFLDLHSKCIMHEDEGIRHVGKTQLVPRAQEHRLND